MVVEPGRGEVSPSTTKSQTLRMDLRRPTTQSNLTPQGLTRSCTSGSLLIVEVEVQAAACRDRVHQGL